MSSTAAILTVPNAVSAARILLAPALGAIAWAGHGHGFLGLLAVLLLSDVADGQLARRLGQVTELGERLDTWADFATHLAAGAGIWLLWPELVRREAPIVGVVVASYLATTLAGVLRYRRLAIFHTWSGKASAWLLAGGAMLLFLGVSPWPFRMAAVVVVLSDVEELAMMRVLPGYRADVPSLWHAWHDRR